MSSTRHRASVLVTGGAGYIGSHVIEHLAAAGHEPVAFDNLYSGHPWAVLERELVVGDLADGAALDALLGARRFGAVIHCAGHIWVGESVAEPAKYYANNATNAFRLFELCARHGVRAIVFSSTAAVYGQPDRALIDEACPPAPINPYGMSKFAAERALVDIANAAGIRYGILRYFNVAGADARARIGEATPDNSHLVKVACEVAIGLRPKLKVNGTDYPTSDGTCIRDYVHVDDLAQAHLLAIEHLAADGESFTLNCGYGHGYSVREVLRAVGRAVGLPIPIEEGARRPGDPPSLVADARAIRGLLGWSPRHDDIDYIVGTAWRWEQRLAELRAAAAGG